MEEDGQDTDETEEDVGGRGGGVQRFDHLRGDADT